MRPFHPQRYNNPPRHGIEQQLEIARQQNLGQMDLVQARNNIAELTLQLQHYRSMIGEMNARHHSNC